MALIDFHCHLDLYPDPAAAVAMAVEHGAYVLSVTTTPSAFVGTRALAPANGRIRTALGLHPELAADRRGEMKLFHRLLPETEYVGEVGLDGSSPHKASLPVQTAVLHEILDACAAAGGRTISLHSRQAAGLLLDMLEFEPLAGRFVLHWFSASTALVERAARLGCWFSVGSAMMASRTGRAAVAAMPTDRVLPETDGPFGTLAGKPLPPGGGGVIYREYGDLVGIDAARAERVMTRNFRHIVGLTASATGVAAAV